MDGCQQEVRVQGGDYLRVFSCPRQKESDICRRTDVRVTNTVYNRNLERNT